MKFLQLNSYLARQYAPDNLARADVREPNQFGHQRAVIARAWQSLVERKQDGIILADEVGLGKTYEALGVVFFYLLHLLSQKSHEDFRVLIVLPPKLITKWEAELERFANQMEGLKSAMTGREAAAAGAIVRQLRLAREIVFRSQTDQLAAGDRPLQVKDSGFFFIHATALTGLMGVGKKAPPASARNAFAKLPWDLAVFDEAHSYAGGEYGSQRSQAVLKLSQRLRAAGGKMVLCTATPFQLDTRELVSLIEFIESSRRKINEIQAAIEAYNQTVVALRQELAHQLPTADSPGPEKIQDLREKLAGQKSCLESALQPYILRTRRPEHEGREQRSYSTKKIPPGDSFPWLYWRVREYTRQLSNSGRQQMRTFLPTTLQMTLSSTEALREHLTNLRGKHGRVKAVDEAWRGLAGALNDRAAAHPKHQALDEFIGSRFQTAAETFDGRLERLADYKCVIFVSRRRTIEVLTAKKVGAAKLFEKLASAVEARTAGLLQEAGIDSRRLLAKLRAAVKNAVDRICVKYNFDVDGSIRIWETPYEGQVDSEYVYLRRIRLGITADLSEIHAADRGLPLISGELTSNLTNKLRDPLSQFDLASRLAAQNGTTTDWTIRLEAIVDKMVSERLDKPLGAIRKVYFGNDGIPDLPREQLRLRLSSLVYSLIPRNPIEALTGDVDFAARQQIIDSFNNDLYPLILICSSVGQEGIDLQKRCNTVVHYDLEWNPAKVEQREGRVDRLGRSSTDQVQVNTFVLTKTYDERILARCENRKLWMELYLCKEWREQGRKLEEEIGLPSPEQGALANPDWLAKYRLNLSPDAIASY